MDAKRLQDGELVDVIGNVLNVYKDSWEAFKLNWQVFAGALAAVLAVVFMGSFLVAVAGGLAITAARGVSLVGFIVFFAFTSVVWLLMATPIVLVAPLVITAQLASARGQRHSFAEFVELSGPRVLGFVGLALLIGLVVTVGLFLLVIPGLVAAFFLMYAPYAYIDQKIGVIDAMKYSFELVMQYWKVSAGIVIVTLVISFISRLPLIGGLTSLALTVMYFCLIAIFYIRITHRAAPVSADKQEPSV